MIPPIAKQREKAPRFEETGARPEEKKPPTAAPLTELEDMIALVEEGNKLIRHCRGILHDAELRIQTLSNPETVQDGTDTDEPDSNEFSLT
ncbi:exodeoxyribonuclease VII small subunit [Akkermansia sp.]|uniref:exodeoxyribonuclease VII small subunit n=1 Tax=Akkermansia sp. TaxID=1872421 RepID=UPI0025BF42D3|nr:exodeoxyribonuclease VII small subunit [Akkermansia sp.]MCD8063249.1 exodeoxyribonuclease VII small subunit [Akkermansia sp.]